MKADLAVNGGDRAGSPTWTDRALVAGLLPLAVIEGTTQANVTWRPVTIALAFVVILSLLGRRSRPFVMVVIAFGSLHAVELAALVAGVDWQGLAVNACVLFLAYSLVRKERNPQRLATGLLLVFAAPVLPLLSGARIATAIGGSMILMVPTAMGAIARRRADGRKRELERAKHLEREQLARELHDTLAHHMSAIAVQAQAGRTLAKKKPDAALAALDVIEEVAARALTDMRSMVRMLRQEGPGERTPQPRFSDVERLVTDLQPRLGASLKITGNEQSVKPVLQTAVYRIVQESLTNTIRHAKDASRVEVSIDVQRDHLVVTVADDGDVRGSSAEPSTGFGLIGMAERCSLLGGTFHAGPNHQGWTVSARFPLRGPRL